MESIKLKGSADLLGDAMRKVFAETNGGAVEPVTDQVGAALPEVEKLHTEGGQLNRHKQCLNG